MLIKCITLTHTIHYLFIYLYPLVFKEIQFIYPVFKSGNCVSIINYLLISCLNVFPKFLEKLLESKTLNIFKYILVNNQHCFQKSKSTLTNCMVYYSDLVYSISNGIQVNAVYTDIKKAFDVVNNVY